MTIALLAVNRTYPSSRSVLIFGDSYQLDHEKPDQLNSTITIELRSFTNVSGTAATATICTLASYNFTSFTYQPFTWTPTTTCASANVLAGLYILRTYWDLGPGGMPIVDTGAFFLLNTAPTFLFTTPPSTRLLRPGVTLPMTWSTGGFTTGTAIVDVVGLDTSYVKQLSSSSAGSGGASLVTSDVTAGIGFVVRFTIKPTDAPFNTLVYTTSPLAVSNADVVVTEPFTGAGAPVWRQSANISHPNVYTIRWQPSNLLGMVTVALEWPTGNYTITSGSVAMSSGMYTYTMPTALQMLQLPLTIPNGVNYVIRLYWQWDTSVSFTSVAFTYCDATSFGFNSTLIPSVILLNQDATFYWSTADLPGQVQIILQNRNESSLSDAYEYYYVTSYAPVNNTGMATFNVTSPIGADDEYRFVIAYINPHSNELTSISDVTTEVTFTLGSLTVAFDFKTLWYGQAPKVSWTALFAVGTIYVDVVNSTMDGVVSHVNSVANPTIEGGTMTWGPIDSDDLPEGEEYYVRVMLVTSTVVGTLVAYSGNFTVSHIDLAGSFVTNPGTDLVIYPNTTFPLQWSTTLANYGTLNIELWRGSTRVSILASAVPSADSTIYINQTFNWRPALLDGDASDNTCYIVFSLVLPDPFTLPFVNRTMGTFKLRAAPYSPLVPQGGNTYLLDARMDMRWQLGTAKVNVYLVKNSITIATLITNGDNTLNTYAWTPQSTPLKLLPGSDYQIRISATDGSITSGFFTLLTVLPQLTAPISGGVYPSGNIMPVTWITGGLPDTVTIVLTLGVPNYTEYTWIGVANTGAFNLTWPIQPLVASPVTYRSLSVTINSVHNAPVLTTSMPFQVADVISVVFNSSWINANYSNQLGSYPVSWIINTTGLLTLTPAAPAALYLMPGKTPLQFDIAATSTTITIPYVPVGFYRLYLSIGAYTTYSSPFYVDTYIASSGGWVPSSTAVYVDDSLDIRLGLFISMPILGAILIELGIVWWKKRGAEMFHMLLARHNDPHAAAGLTGQPTAGEMAVEMGSPSSAPGSPDPIATNDGDGSTNGAGVTSNSVSFAAALDVNETSSATKKRESSSSPAAEREDYMW